MSRSDAEGVIGSVTGSPARIDIPLPGFIASACVFTSSDGTLAVAVGPQNISKSDFESLMKLVPGMTAVSGVGDSAFSGKVTATSSMAGAASIFVLSGNTYFTLQATSKSKSSDQLMQSLETLAATAAKKVP